MKEAVIVAGCRTAVGRAKKGALAYTRPDELAASVIAGAVDRVKGLKKDKIDDVIFGCAMPEKEQGMNLARIALLRAGLPNTVPGMTINRFCSTGLQTIALAAERIQCGAAKAIVAGGVESMTMLGFDASMRAVPNPGLMESAPDTYLSMGLTAEILAEKYGINREDSDAFAVHSHQKAVQAIEQGRFDDEIIPVVAKSCVSTGTGAGEWETVEFKMDECPRDDTTLEKLSELKPVFKKDGICTAGNSSPVSDGAAAVVVMEKEMAMKMGLEIMAIYKGYMVVGVPPEIMGIGPVEAIPKALNQVGMMIDDIDLIELNEAFACQSLAVIRELEMAEDKINVNGGAIALGHPLGCTGAKLTVTLMNQLKRMGGGLGMVTMCVGGGMGAAGIFEVPAG